MSPLSSGRPLSAGSRRPLLPTGRFARSVQLLVGLVGFGVGITMTLQAGLGVAPWDVLHVGISRQTGMQVGTAGILVGIVLVVLGLALRVRPGVGTVANVIVVGLVINALLGGGWLADAADGGLVGRSALLVGGIAVTGVGSALYIGSHFGSGPRDGLMVGVHTRFGIRVGVARFIVEALALLAGVALGGPVGVGTLVFTVAIGPAVELSFQALRLRPARDAAGVP